MKKLLFKLVMRLSILYVRFRTWKHYSSFMRVIGIISAPFVFVFRTLKRFFIAFNRRRSRKILNKYFSCTGSLVLGLPGSGKTTFAAYIAKLCKNAGYPCYTNFTCSIAGKYDFADLGKYDYGDPEDLVPAYWIFDEAGIDANNRNFSKVFNGDEGRAALEHLKLLRHFECRMIILSQSMDCDLKLRLMCSKIWLLYKGPFCSNLTPVQRCIGCDEVQHQLMDMYDISSPFRRAFQRIYFFRRPYYKYFDTHERPALPHISAKNASVERSPKGSPSKGPDTSSDEAADILASLFNSALNSGLTK